MAGRRFGLADAIRLLSEPPRRAWPEGVVHHGVRILMLLGLACSVVLLFPVTPVPDLPVLEKGMVSEETIIARVGEGTVSSIGSSASHKTVLENPDQISRYVLERGLDAGTAFEILSIDIADVDVGRNIGAELQTDQAEADKKIAQAKAEERRAMAMAQEQEMRARVVEAEAQVPLAMAEAFRSGNLGVMDYYKMENIQSDTRMRGSIAGDDEDQQVQR